MDYDFYCSLYSSRTVNVNPTRCKAPKIVKVKNIIPAKLVNDVSVISPTRKEVVHASSFVLKKESDEPKLSAVESKPPADKKKKK